MYNREKDIAKLPKSFEKWLDKELSIKRQTYHNYVNFFKLCSKAIKLLNSRVSFDFFIKNHRILIEYIENLSEDHPWKHELSCNCEKCLEYF